jgi:hypothetical protein
MGRPVGVGISLLQPRKHGREFASSRGKCDAISKINASITQGKEFCAQEIAAIEAAKMNGLPQKQRLEALLPAEQQVIRKRSRSVVQPIVLESSPCLRTSIANAREASVISLGISGHRMSQSLVWRETTPSKLSAAPPIATASNRSPRRDKYRSNRLKISRVFMVSRYHYNRYLISVKSSFRALRVLSSAQRWV